MPEDFRNIALQTRQAIEDPMNTTASAGQELIDVEAEREMMMRAQIEDQLALQMAAQQSASMPRHYLGRAEMEYLTAAGLTKTNKTDIAPPVIGEFLSSPDLRHLALSSLDGRDTAMQRRRIAIARALSESRQKENQSIEWERRALESSLMSKSLRVNGRQTMIEMLAAPVNRTETKVNTTNQRAPGFLSALLPKRRE